MKFEWDEEKNQINIKKHGISFENAIRIFSASYYEWHDIKHSGYNPYGEWEDRYIALGWVNEVLYVCYTIRDKENAEYYRIISARIAEKKEADMFFRWLNGV